LANRPPNPDASGNPKKRKQQPEDGEGGKKQKGGNGVPVMVVKKEHKHEAVVVNPESRTSSTTMEQITQERFADQNISKEAKHALKTVIGYEFMTKVQAATIKVGLAGEDLLAKAKTGTGKTIAFLLPALERALKTRKRGKVSVLIVSPTRELAQQIAAEATQMMTSMKMTLQCVVGGTKINVDHNRFDRGIPDVLVATPGRLNDHLKNTMEMTKLSGMSDLSCLVLDEADQLLEQGFQKEITAMLGLLPAKTTRQTLLFSATMPANVLEIAKLALRKEYKHVDCVGTESNTHTHVPQSYTLTDIKAQFAELAHCLQEGMQDPNHKIMVFFTTARLTGLFTQVFNGMAAAFGDVLEIHSRLSQGKRNNTSQLFRDKKTGILFTSDVSARGMDYPDVTKVIQVGLPSDKAQYVHRLGRTARAGKGGSGVLLLADFEKRFLDRVADLKLEERAPLTREEQGAWQTRVDGAMRRVDPQLAQQTYQAWLGFYNGNLKVCLCVCEREREKERE
jgi:ATP-dependent RNA helicase MSS116